MVPTGVGLVVFGEITFLRLCYDVAFAVGFAVAGWFGVLLLVKRDCAVGCVLVVMDVLLSVWLRVLVYGYWLGLIWLGDVCLCRLLVWYCLAVGFLWWIWFGGFTGGLVY